MKFWERFPVAPSLGHTWYCLATQFQETFYLQCDSEAIPCFRKQHEPNKGRWRSVGSDVSLGAAGVWGRSCSVDAPTLAGGGVVRKLPAGEQMKVRGRSNSDVHETDSLTNFLNYILYIIRFVVVSSSVTWSALTCTKASLICKTVSYSTLFAAFHFLSFSFFFMITSVQWILQFL